MAKILYHGKCFQLFPEPEDIDEMNDIMQAFTDAWNFFPHKELGGKAPNELFKEGIKNVPKYEKYLKQIVKNKRMCEEYYNVADIFFERALHIGFVIFGEIRPDFIQKEFPNWWPTHVMYSNLKPHQVQEHLEKFFIFAGLVYGIDIRKYGFK